MRREKTVIICERCGYEKTVDAHKIGPIHKRASYPREWRKIYKKVRVCPGCGADFDEVWHKYMSGGIVVDAKKTMQVTH